MRCHCGSGKKYKKCHMDQDEEVAEAQKWIDPLTNKLRCFSGREYFKEGDKVDWIYYNMMRMRVPICIPHKQHYETTGQMVFMEQLAKKSLEGGTEADTTPEKKEKGGGDEKTAKTI